MSLENCYATTFFIPSFTILKAIKESVIDRNELVLIEKTLYCFALDTFIFLGYFEWIQYFNKTRPDVNFNRLGSFVKLLQVIYLLKVTLAYYIMIAWSAL